MRRAPLRGWVVGGALALSACAPPAGPAVGPGGPADAPAADVGAAGNPEAVATAPAPPGPAPPPQVTAAASASGEQPWDAGVTEPPPADVEPWGVWLPRLDVAASLAPLGLEEDGQLEVPDHPDVAGWYAGGPRPGEVGPAVVAGHVDSRTGPAVFARLDELRPGDVAHLVYRDGFVATYRIAGVERFPKHRFPTEAVYGDTEMPVLRLITCGGSFDRSAGSYRDNVIAYGDLVGTWRYDPASA